MRDDTRTVERFTTRTRGLATGQAVAPRADGFEDVHRPRSFAHIALAVDDVDMLCAPSAILLELEPLLVKVDEEERGLIPQLLVREQHVPSSGGEHLEDQ